MIDLDSDRAKMCIVQATMIRDDGLGDDAVSNHDQVIGRCPDASCPPIDFDDLALNLIGHSNPITRPEWAFNVDREPREDVGERILESQAKDNGKHTGGRQYGGDRLLEHGVHDADERHDIDENRCQIGKKATRVRLIVVWKPCTTKDQIKEALDEPRTQNPPCNAKQLHWQARRAGKSPEKILAEQVAMARK